MRSPVGCLEGHAIDDRTDAINDRRDQRSQGFVVCVDPAVDFILSVCVLLSTALNTCAVPLLDDATSLIECSV